ncbi:MAG: hypothetical protein C4527_17355 [Candidatus Omnitrophota bacterium]|nr:MAG: hypothetical protein C4527_17355 [Candidatus Omnitrophota bacterium]
MPKRKSLWPRETPCLVCETKMINYQFMAKSMTIIYDEWMVPHFQPVGDYEDFPELLKTTICPGCLIASNEYGFGVDSYKYFSRNVRKNEQLKEIFQRTMNERFHLLANEFNRFERECAILDVQNKRPAHTRTRATFEKIWTQKEKYGVPFFNMMFNEPRDYATALVLSAMDRYCQMVRIAYNNDIEPSDWENDSLKTAVEAYFQANTLSMKSPEPRFYFMGMNYMHSIQILEELIQHVEEKDEARHHQLINHYWKEAYTAMRFCFDNDDLTAIPNELKEGGMNYLMAKLHFRFGDEEAGKKCLRFAKNYADNRLKTISNKNQQNFVNTVDDMYKEHFQAKESAEE